MKQTLQSVTNGPSLGGATIPAKTSIDMGPIQKAFPNESIPHLTPDPLGRYRLLTALKRKFGPMYSSHPDAMGAIHHFEKEYNYFRTLRNTLSKGSNG